MLNAGGRVLRGLGANPPSLDADSLLRAARSRADLSDFGAWRFDEPLERLLKSYRDEARLTTLGRITARELVVTLLENLLLLEAERKRNPRIEQQRVADPVFIVGLPRTGTTHLHGLITQDPRNRAPLTWEVMFPAARGAREVETAAVRARTASRLDWANRLAPEFMRIHPIAAELPQECIAIQAQIFMSIQFHTTHAVPSYEDWFERDSQDLSYGFHRYLLQHLQAQRPGDRWVLKAPGHLFGLGALLRRYPHAKIVHTHRDPLRVMASMASHATVLRRAFSDAADPLQIARD
ncbi:MAG TPA: sulfotransferase, partial [Gammaproteobacteria bacterium]|nr:sulfotransferase [Gammaproteobacteria bacterium]